MTKLNKSILITGGLGFIGYHLCTALKRHDPSTKLTIVDNLSSTKIDPSLLAQLGETHVMDFCDYEPHGKTFDEIYHLASPVGSLGILENNGYVAHSISKLAMRAADIASDCSAKLLYLSSSEVYGRDGQHNEDIELRVPSLRGTRMEYALGKLTAEHTLLNRSSNNEFTLRIVRPFNVIGPWQSAKIGFVIPTFFDAALTRKPLQLFGDGSQKRSFCLVDDLVSGMMAVQDLGQNQAIYNLGNPLNIVSIKQLGETIVKLCKSTSPLQPTDPTRLYGSNYLEAFQKLPDITKARQHTHWQPNADLEAALTNCKYFYEMAQKSKPELKSVLESASV